MTIKNTQHQSVEKRLAGKIWTYTVKSGDGLLGIVRKEFKLKDPQDTQEIKQTVDQIVAQNPTIKRDRIDVGDKLTLRFGKSVAPKRKAWTYTVKSGDTLNAIVMQEFKLTLATEITERANLIAAQSGIKNVNSLNVGDVLKLRY